MLSKAQFKTDEEISLSSVQVQDIFYKFTGLRVGIVQTNHIQGDTDISEIVNEETPYCLLFSPVNSATSGHWQSLFYEPDEAAYYFFDSYGHALSKLVNKVDKVFGHGAFGNSDKLGELLYNSKKIVYMNTFHYQSDNSDVCTCGRHSVACLIYYIKNKNNGENYNFATYYDYITAFKTKNNLQTYDDAVTLLTNKGL